MSVARPPAEVARQIADDVTILDARARGEPRRRDLDDVSITGLAENVGFPVGNDERSQEAIATGATRVATTCPFCLVMLDDGVKGQGYEDDEVKVADISVHLLEAIERGAADHGVEQGLSGSPRSSTELTEPPLSI